MFVILGGHHDVQSRTSLLSKRAILARRFGYFQERTMLPRAHSTSKSAKYFQKSTSNIREQDQS